MLKFGWKKFISCDLDGTFLCKSEAGLRKNLEAVLKLEEQTDYRIIVCTGRDRGGVSTKTLSTGLEYDLILDLDTRPGVYSNGARVHSVDDSVIYRYTIPEKLVRTVVELVLREYPQ